MPHATVRSDGRHLVSGQTNVPGATEPTWTVIAVRGYHRHVAIDSCPASTARDVLSPAALLFHSLADPVRLTIVQRLAQGEARVVDLTRQLELAQSTVSKHLACLRDCRLVDFRAEGRQSFYFVARPELLDLLRSAERLLEATGDAVDLCPVYGSEATAGQAVS